MMMTTIELTAERPENEPNNVITFKIPEHFLCLIFNGDTSGYTDEDIKQWEKFTQKMIQKLLLLWVCH